VSLDKMKLPFGMLICLVAALLEPMALAQNVGPSAVSALGRLEPENGVLRIAAASTSRAISGSVINELLVEEGDWAEAGQLLATTDSTSLMRAQLRLSEAELELVVRAAKSENSKADEACTLADVAASESARRANLLERKLTSTEEAEHAQGEAEAKAASCTAARANASVAESAIEVARNRISMDEVEVERTLVRAPVAGRVLEVHAHAGEFTSPGGVLDLGRTDHMFAIAEVYEADIGRVSVGQNASITSNALPGALSGKVERIRGQVHKQDVTGTDPAARKDARIIEVEIRLDDSETAAGLTNLQVEIVIGG
jgi:HlyD family secretion protein